jgi:hypothetical protein
VNLTEAEPGLEAWLAAGFHGSMNYMASHGLKRARPAELVPGTVSVITVRMDYLPGNVQNLSTETAWQALEQAQQGVVSVYAQNSNIQRLQAILGGELNITASSILQDVLYNTDHPSTTCNSDPYACAGKPLTAFDGGTITLKQSYVSLINAQDPPGLIPAGVLSYSDALYGPSNAGSLVALDSVWLQTTSNQSAADLQNLFGNLSLLTSGIPLNLDDLGGGVNAYYPLPSGAYPNPQGPLIDQISDADGVNQLINPIDGSPILLDVYGQPRTHNGLRTIGAVEPVPGPLPLAGATAVLAWSRRLRRRIRHAESRPFKGV